MKLLRMNESGQPEPIDTEYQLRGMLDAFGAAQGLGDGNYIADFMDGTFLPFMIEDGQPPQGGDFLPDVQYGNPYKDTEEGGRFSRDNAAFPSMVPDVAGRENDDQGVSFENYVPQDERGA